MAALAGVEGSGRSYALLADGTTMTIRPAGPGDYEPVRQLHEAMSPDNLYFRFFSASRASAEREARRVCLEGGPGLGALLGLLGDELVGVASYELTAPATAEVALAVADGMHRRGIATLLLEHLVSLARARGVKVFVAEVLPDNYAVLRVLGDAGLAVRRRSGNGVVELSMPVPPNAALGEASAYLDAVAGREKRADVASLAPLGPDAPVGSEQLARQQAIKQIERRRRFRISTAWSAIAMIILVAIWAEVPDGT